MHFRKNIYMMSVVAGLLFSSALYAQSLDELVDKAMRGDHREAANVARDEYRHPKETLEFFGLEPTMSVVEIWPSKGWYTEILAPVLRDYGVYYAAGFALSAHKTPDWRHEMQIAFADKLAKHPEVYDHVVVTELSVPERTTIAPPGTVDMILTFRNVHNWMKGGYTQAMLETFYRTLAPGGILGVVEHRANPKTSFDEMVKTGYVTEEFITQLASAVGFELVATSEINANPNDSKDYPEGVWTLPPTLRYCKGLKDGASRDKCIDKYMAIGESDRMTLKFMKPLK